MRKVYQPRTNLLALPIAVAAAAVVTVGLFCIIPFSHLVNKPTRTLELRKTSALDLPPPADDPEMAPPPEIEAPPEAPPEPVLAEAPQRVAISADLEVAVGSGGVLAGFGEVRSLAAAETVQAEAFDVTDLEKRPEAVSQTPPTYPPELRKAKIEGSVTLVFVLDETGRVEDPRVENSSRPEFEKPALDAIRRWRFRPGMKDGQPVRTYIRVPLRFRVASG
jgi:protein TonB